MVYIAPPSKRDFPLSTALISACIDDECLTSSSGWVGEVNHCVVAFGPTVSWACLSPYVLNASYPGLDSFGPNVSYPYPLGPNVFCPCSLRSNIFDVCPSPLGPNISDVCPNHLGYHNDVLYFPVGHIVDGCLARLNGCDVA